MSFISNVKKGISLTLALMILLLSSCGNSDNKASGKTESDSSSAETTVKASESISETSENTQEETASIIDSLPVADFEGKTVRGTTFYESDDYWEFSRLSSEELTGEILNDTIYNRNIEVENRLNVKLEFQYFKNSEMTNSNIKKAILASDPIYDYVMPELNFAADLAQEDYLINLKNVDSIDLSNPAWDQNALDYFSIFDKIYYGISDISLCKNETVWVDMFNKRMISEFNLEDPYELVRSGKWTFDKMAEMMEAVTADLNGDGKMRNVDDRFGLATHGTNYHAMLISAGEPFCEINDEGMPELSLNDERYLAVYDKISDLFGKFKNSCDKEFLDIFRKGNALFCGEIMAYVRHFRDMDDDFGVIPTPKYDEEQSRYYAYSIPYNIAPACIPVTSQDPEMTGTVLQAMSIVSDVYLTPAYYEVCIRGKGMRDVESLEMLDLILDSLVFDLAVVYDWGGFVGSIPSLLTSQKPFTSNLKAKEPLMKRQLQKMIDDFSNTVN